MCDPLGTRAAPGLGSALGVGISWGPLLPSDFPSPSRGRHSKWRGKAVPFLILVVLTQS
jgi:hypothetical protein